MCVVGAVEGFDAGGFLCGEGGVEFAGGDLFRGGVGVAEFAGGEVVFGGAHRWAEGAADDGAVSVEIAGSVGGVERGTGFGVADGVFVGEEWRGFVVFGEDAGGVVSGEEWGEAGEGFCGALLDVVEAFGVGLFEGGEAFAETVGVFGGDREDAVAALSASRATDEVRAAAERGGCQSCVYDLDE